MKWFLKSKEFLKAFYEKYDTYINGLFKFVLSFGLYLVLMYHTGYNAAVSSPYIAAGMAAVCAFVSHALIPVFMAILLTVELTAVSVETAVILLIFLALMLLLYFVFKAGDSWLLPFAMVVCLLSVPGVIIPVALLISPVQIVVVAFGVIIYAFLVIVKRDVSILTGQTGGLNLAGRVNYLLNDLFSSKTLMLILICVCVSMLFISVIRRSRINYSGVIAAIVGDFIFVIGMLTGSYFMEVNISYINLAVSMVINILLTVFLINFTINLDYKRTEQVQFEDDEYYYYVKAIPKRSISVTEKRVETITGADDEMEDFEIDVQDLFLHKDDEN